ncbi:tRNA (guanine-N7-)-methyltransferase [Actimicrobium sp. GrIS 1.19]|uniref:tRNA (guanine(46)-N(7))-methyltransferase TrmB n=1 Tax=Actimicrobium sp. GrIS 1.19 TaxID=3071708 RepID=UPI002E06B82B|nr:tRNA (guanine-N7-)-methyltransferase [Actimicrobium sp. GrIS 1.19]
MQANSRAVSSSQTEAHPQLARLVARHATTQFQKPVMAYNRAAFALFLARWRSAGTAPLILDAGCGVGLSSRHLAAASPDCFVLGIDQSADRIERHTLWPDRAPDNLLLLRADLVDFWRLLADEGVTLHQHFLLYPNPWPKIGHLARRWHGHPVFPTAVALGGVIECRSNWPIYVDECAAALRQLGVPQVVIEPYAPANPITPFEAKYLASGHALWRCRSHMAGSA